MHNGVDDVVVVVVDYYPLYQEVRSSYQKTIISLNQATIVNILSIVDCETCIVFLG